MQKSEKTLFGPNGQIAPPSNRAMHIHNLFCAYCSAELNCNNRSKEHVIGRRFVPIGKLNGFWNLIFNACKTCNSVKSDLEDDIALITMLPDAWGQYADDDPALKAEVERRLKKSYSRRSGKLVGESTEHLQIKKELGPGFTITFDLKAPPHFDQERAASLARLHVVAFYYMITYNETTRHGRYWPGDFYVAHDAMKSDWGNPRMKGFMNATKNWDHRVHAIGADGFFKIMIRKNPTEECWAWALEWNKKYRIIGFIGKSEIVISHIDALPRNEAQIVHQEGRDWIATRLDTPINSDDDILFADPPESWWPELRLYK